MRFLVVRFRLAWCVVLYGITLAFGSKPESVCADTPPAADVPADIGEWLNRPLLAAEQPQVEIERFLEARIPRLPAISDVKVWEQEAERIRREMLGQIVFRGEAAKWRETPLRVEWLEVLPGGEEYRIKKLRYEAVPGLWIPALLYEPLSVSGPTAVCLNVNGHDGKGKAAEYKQIRCINQAKRGMLALNVEWLGMGQLRDPEFSHSRMNQLDLCGTSGLAPFYLALKKGLDVLLSLPHADPQRVAVAGLSGGGWQTIYISSLDTRVTLANPVAGYSSFLTRIHHHSDLGDSEQTPNDMATVADYTHLTALLAPRTALLTYNLKDDCCFASGHALPPLLAAAAPMYKLFGQEQRLESHVNHDPGTHNFERDNREALYRMFARHFFPDRDVSPTELDCQGELKSAEELHVSLPEPNASLNEIAKMLAKTLPRDDVFPQAASEVETWQAARRQNLQDVLHFRDYPLMAEQVDEQPGKACSVTRWRLRIAEAWTIPAVVFTPPAPAGTVLWVHEEGRAQGREAIDTLLKNGQRVCAVDPFYLGESQIKSRAYLWALLVQAVGERPAGVQAGQLAAIAKWLHANHEQPVSLALHGERVGLAGLCAAALAPDHIESVRLEGALASLKQVIERNDGYEAKPELFCFGLLERFDVATLVALAAPREVKFVAAGERHRAELRRVAQMYRLLGREFDPCH